MKCGLNHGCCPPEDSHRVRSAGVPCPAGFSLIEVLAVMAIVLLLFALYWGPGTSKSRQRQLQTDCQTHLQKIFMALNIYANDHAGGFPESAGARTSAEALDGLVPRYTVDTAAFFCPAVKGTPAPSDRPFRQERISYAYCMGRRAADAQQLLMSDEQVDARAKAAGELAFSSTGKAPGNNHGDRGGNVLFCDGHTEATPPRLPFSLTLTQGVALLNPKGP
jgi:prepilin-type N-terminal cleavage/methylation domain-containing protein/prepilin-type processing-associated H-X9-DG protein